MQVLTTLRGAVEAAKHLNESHAVTEVGVQVSCLVSITYGGSSPADPQASVPDALYGSHDHGATKPPFTQRVTSVVTGRPGDLWLDTMRFTRIERAARDGRHGYEISYDIAGHGQVVLFWPRDRIDFDGRSPGSRLESMKLREGRLWYPRRITSKSRLARADLLAVLNSFLSGHVEFERVRQFVFQYFEGEEDVQPDEDLELVFAALGPYLEHEEAYGDDKRVARMQRLRDALSAAGAPVERTVWALEFDRIGELQRRLDAGAITRAVYETQLQELSPAEFDVRRVALWAAAHRQHDEMDPALLT